jgi:signal transduction histidine kinase
MVFSSTIMAVSYPKRFTPAAVALGSSPVLRALRAASRKAYERLVTENVEGAEELGNELTLLAETVHSMAAESHAGSISPTNVVFSRTLIDALRGEFVVRLTKNKSGRIHAKELIAVMSALEELTRIAQAPADLTPSHATNGFVKTLESSDASNAVLEIAHDMRSPLSAIMFLVETLRTGQSGPITAVQ